MGALVRKLSSKLSLSLACSLAREAIRFLKEKFTTFLSSAAFTEADTRASSGRNLFSRMASKCSSPFVEQTQRRLPLLLQQSPNYNLAQILFINFICIILSKCNIVSPSSSINTNPVLYFLSVNLNFWDDLNYR